MSINHYRICPIKWYLFKQYLQNFIFWLSFNLPGADSEAFRRGVGWVGFSRTAYSHNFIMKMFENLINLECRIYPKYSCPLHLPYISLQQAQLNSAYLSST